MRGERKIRKNSALVIASGLHPLMMIGEGGGCRLCINTNRNTKRRIVNRIYAVYYPVILSVLFRSI
jgi:hypothetical protein